MLWPVQKWARFYLSEMEDSGSISLFFLCTNGVFHTTYSEESYVSECVSICKSSWMEAQALTEPLTSCSPGTPDSLKSPLMLPRPSDLTSVFGQAEQPCVTEARLCHWNWAQVHLRVLLLVPLELDATMYHVIDFVTSEDIEYAYFPFYPKQSMNLMQSPSHYS